MAQVKVVVRVRPLNSREIKRKDVEAIEISETGVKIEKKSYVFDQVLPPSATQQCVFEKTGQQIVRNVVKGYNGCLMAYGQTGSGKTYSMIGSPESHGIVGRSVKEVFATIYTTNEKDLFLISAQYLEIYSERIYDLLGDAEKTLQIKKDASGAVGVAGATERFVSSPEEVLELLIEGNGNRRVSATRMNEESSRSHAVLVIRVSRKDPDSGVRTEGRLYLVDLAGSERQEKTRAQGKTAAEGIQINLSLSTLGRVINGLAAGHKHVPFRESKLTFLLQEALAGNAHTCLLICVSPASSNAPETRSTLEFGKRAKNVKLVPQINKKLRIEDVLRQLEAAKAENVALHQELELLRIEKEQGMAADGKQVSDEGTQLKRIQHEAQCQTDEDYDEYMSQLADNDKLKYIDELRGELSQMRIEKKSADEDRSKAKKKLMLTEEGIREAITELAELNKVDQTKTSERSISARLSLFVSRLHRRVRNVFVRIAAAGDKEEDGLAPLLQNDMPEEANLGKVLSMLNALVEPKENEVTEHGECSQRREEPAVDGLLQRRADGGIGGSARKTPQILRPIIPSQTYSGTGRRFTPSQPSPLVQSILGERARDICDSPPMGPFPQHSPVFPTLLSFTD